VVNIFSANRINTLQQRGAKRSRKSESPPPDSTIKRFRSSDLDKMQNEISSDLQVKEDLRKKVVPDSFWDDESEFFTKFTDHYPKNPFPSISPPIPPRISNDPTIIWFEKK